MCNIKKEDLRPCKFTLEGHNVLGFAHLSMFDYENDAQREEATRTRTGLFHCWGTTLHPKAEEGHVLTCGIVEDVQDGNIYLVDPEEIQFTTLSKH